MPRQAPGKKTISVALPEDTYNGLKDWANQKEWSVAKAAWKLIEIALDSEANAEPDPTPPQKGKGKAQ